MPKKNCKFTQREVTRAFRAAKDAGLAVRIDISTSGQLSIIPTNADPHAKTNDGWDDAIAKKPVSVRS